MSFASKSFVLLLSIVSVFGADKETKFDPGPLESLPNVQTVEKLTVAADVYATAEKAKKAFGKLNPNQHGILPVLVMMRNSTGQSLTLEGMRVEYILPTRQKVEATPAREVARARGVEQPRVNRNPLPVPLPPRSSVKKSPLNVWEIEGRAFAAMMLPPGETASGFFYFQVSPRPGSVLYVTGIQEAATRRELFYVELPLAQ